jgi:hypothetical protein
MLLERYKTSGLKHLHRKFLYLEPITPQVEEMFFHFRPLPGLLLNLERTTPGPAA